MQSMIHLTSLNACQDVEEKTTFAIKQQSIQCK